MERDETPRDPEASTRSRWCTAVGGVALVLAASCGEAGLDGPARGHAVEEPGLVEQALPVFLAARGRTWPRSSSRVAQARGALSKGRIGVARRLLREELEADPANVEALFLDNGLLYQEGRFGVALVGLEEVLRRGPSFAGNEHAFFLYGACQMRLGDAERARAAFHALLELVPGHGEALQALGELALQRGDADQALLFFERAVESLRAAQARGLPVRAQARAHAQMGNACLQKGELERARECLERALSLNPEDAQAHYSLSRVLLRLGDTQGAEAAMREFRQRQKADGLNRAATGGGR